MITKEEREYILSNMKTLLEEYDYEWSEDALDLIIERWASKKEVLIEAFKKHPNYQPGKFMIAFASNYEREIDPDASQEFWRFLRDNAINQFRDSLPEDIRNKMASWQNIPTALYDILCNLYHYAERCISEETTNILNNACPALRAHVGEKTSRVINRLCHYLGYDRAEGYTRAFARYSDSLSPIVIKRHTILSLNPLDYLTMSFGNSWASCHTIDKLNRRDMPNSYSGAYSSGTMSYMLDPSSMVMYTVDSSYKGTDYWDQPKVTRQMFHWGEEKLVQGRLYPQSNDGKNSYYEPYRHIVQEIMSTIFNFANMWTLKKGTNNANKFVRSYGTHYRDYQYYSGCTVSLVKGSENENMLTIGANPICVNCGCSHGIENNISCCGGGGVKYCPHCGCEVDEDDGYWINGELYCEDCVSYCEHCEEYYFRGDMTWVDDADGYVCDDCLDRYYTYCDNCNEYHSEDDCVYVEDLDINLCQRCFDRNIRECNVCGRQEWRHNLRLDRGELVCSECLSNRQLEENEENN